MRVSLISNEIMIPSFSHIGTKRFLLECHALYEHFQKYCLRCLGGALKSPLLQLPVYDQYWTPIHKARPNFVGERRHPLIVECPTYEGLRSGQNKKECYNRSFMVLQHYFIMKGVSVLEASFATDSEQPSQTGDIVTRSTANLWLKYIRKEMIS